MAAPTSNCRTLKEPLANGEPSIHGPKAARIVVVNYVRVATNMKRFVA